MKRILLLGSAFAGAAALAVTLTQGTGAASAPDDAQALFNPTYMARLVCNSHQSQLKAVSQARQRLAMASTRKSESGGAVLWDNLGDLTYPVTVKKDLAQSFFNQGVKFAYGFNHYEAARSFQKAQDIDGTCAMCYWGEAWVYGPNINAPMMPEAVKPALKALAKAQALKDGASEKERGLIDALAYRYSDDKDVKQSDRDRKFAEAMGKLHAAYPDDLNLAAWYAESLMNTQPWDYWEADKRTPKGNTQTIIKVIEGILEKDPKHPAAIHLYIHMVEATTTPNRAEPYADTLGGLMPGAGHLVHMPSHIYYRVGRWIDSLNANIEAAKADEKYLESVDVQNIYSFGYYPHNVHFILTSAQMAGDGKTAREQAEKLDGLLGNDALKVAPFVQPIKAAPLYAHAQFSDLDTVMALPEPDGEYAFITAMWHYARAVALAASGDTEKAAAEAKAIETLGDTGDFRFMTEGAVPAYDILDIAHNVALARVAQAEKDYAKAEEYYLAAVKLQDGLPYTEPPYWYYPVRQSLGAVQLMAGKAAAAEETFRQSLVNYPNNGWALYGMMKAQEAQKKTRLAKLSRDLLDKAWIGTEETLDLAKL